MKRKRFVIILSVLLFTLSACTKEEMEAQPEWSEQYIEFGSPSIWVDADTRGPVEQLQDGSSFGVLGYCLAKKAPDDENLNPATGNQLWQYKKQLCYPEVFYNVPVTYSGGICTYDDLRKWYDPVDYKYSFFAYYPYGEGKGFTVTTGEKTTGAPKVKFSIPFSSTEVSTPLEVNDVPDAMVAQEIDVTRNTGQVQLNFLHLLTGLNFQVNNYNATESGDAGKKVTIHSLKLYGTFYKSIEINFDSGYSFPNDETFSGTYTIVSDNSDIEVPGLTSKSEIGGKTILMVSNLSVTTGSSAYLGDLKLSIVYSFNGKDHYQSEPITRPENFLPAGGTIYTAQLNFIGDSFVLNFVVDKNQQWEDGGDSNITFE